MDFGLRKVIAVTGIIIVLSCGAAKAGILVNETFDKEFGSGWTKAPGAVVQMQDNSARIENLNTTSLRRSFIFRNSGADGRTDIQGGAVYNFFHHDLQVTAELSAFDGTPTVPNGVNSFFIGIGDDAVPGQIYGGPECDNGVFAALERADRGDGAFLYLSLRENRGGQTHVTALGRVTTVPESITLVLNKTIWEVALGGAKFTEWGSTSKNGTLTSVTEQDFSRFNLSVGVANLGPAAVTKASGVTLDHLSVETSLPVELVVPVVAGEESVVLIPEQVAFEQYAVRTTNSVAVVYPHPDGIEKSPDYRLFVSGKEVFCYADRQFNPDAPKDEFNMTTSPQAYAIFDFVGSVDLEVEILNSDLLEQTKRFVVTPYAQAVAATLNGNHLSFTLNHPGTYVVDPDGKGFRALQLLTAAPEETVPDADDPDVIYFGPGVHDFEDPIELQSGQTLYVAGGAVLRPLPNVYRSGWENGKKQAHYSGRSYEKVVHPICSDYARDITIKGRGVISAERGLPAGKRFGLMDLHHGENIRIEDVTITHSSAWTLHLYCSTNSVIDGVRIMGWFTNCDGPCINSCNNIQVRNCYVHTADDGLELKTDQKGNGVRNIIYENCVLWADVGTAMGITHEITDPVSNVIFRNHTILHFKYRTDGEWDVPHRGAILVHPAFGGLLSNLCFENITLESQDTSQPTILVYNGKHNRNDQVRYGHGTPYAEMENIVFRNIRVLPNGDFSPSIRVYDHSDGGTNYRNLVFNQVGSVSSNGALESLPLTVRGTPEILIQK